MNVRRAKSDTLRHPLDLLRLNVGDFLTKGDLYELIRLSKRPGSRSWRGAKYAIGNTPQQGINWVGVPGELFAVIIKSKTGKYSHDRWVDDKKSELHYSFKARSGKVHTRDTANRVLIDQPVHGYPILYFVEIAGHWSYEGGFNVIGVRQKYVILKRIGIARRQPLNSEDFVYPEGGRKFKRHLVVERSRAVVKIVKAERAWICEICGLDFGGAYGQPYIEAHHKTPIAERGGPHGVTRRDLALLCPNCHRAVHIHMRKAGSNYSKIRRMLKNRVRGN